MVRSFFTIYQGRAERAARRWRDLLAREHNLARKPDDVRSQLASAMRLPESGHMGAATPP